MVAEFKRKMLRILTEVNFIILVAHFHSILLSTGFLRLHFGSVRKNARCGLEVRGAVRDNVRVDSY